MIERYLKTRWTFNGMDYPELNCWGLARLARHELYGLPLLPAFGAIHAHDKRGLTKACDQVVNAYLVPSSPKVGALATIWRGRLCTHIALVIEVESRLAALETNEATGARWLWLADFEAQHLKVIYYHES